MKTKQLKLLLEDRLDETMMFHIRGGDVPPTGGGGTEPDPDPIWPPEPPPPPPPGG